MPFAQIDEGVRLYYELTGPEDVPVVLQFGGGLFGRHNFGLVNDGFRERGFRLLSFDARGYGASSAPRTSWRSISNVGLSAQCRSSSTRTTGWAWAISISTSAAASNRR